MQIKNMFEKKIDRDIKGVIKVGQSDEENVYQELDEYVVTKELLKHFRDFFNNYEKGVDGYTDKMGVWISGFFGSGKSHFLKILSYLLKNSTVEGKRAIEYFTDGKKIEDPMLIAEMTKAGTIESDVMLFNIDSKGSAKVGSGKEAIVEVFMKVFNEMQGYCGSIPYLAEFERQLDNEGRFEEFKEKFEANAGAPWEKKRQAFAVIQDKVVKTLVEMNFMSEEAARNWCKNAKGNYDLSIEKFVSLVQEYCAKKGPNHHVIFLVDEIGQYIADDTQLMLNLQTIVEDLGTACKGKAWVIVTSQEDIDSITKTKGNDFSKIQGRFDTRLSLSASNVDEVIRKRVLAKNETATQILRLLYEQKESIIKNLITFTADTADKKLYADKADFADCYPFIPYQFNLLGQVLTAVRTHGASGKHLSDQSRSMAYWLSEKELCDFGNTKFSEIFTTREGMTTANNELFLKMWTEVSCENINYRAKNEEDTVRLNKKWYPYNKGGTARKWFGNNELVVNWKNKGRDIKNCIDEKTNRIRSHNYNNEFSFKESGTWTAICSGMIMVRYSPQGALFDSKGASFFSENHSNLLWGIGLLNSKVSNVFLKVLSPSYEYKVGHIANVPVICRNENEINHIVSECILLSKEEWNSYEISWNFKRHPLISVISRNRLLFDDTTDIDLAECYICWENECNERFNKLKANEEELNRIFIDIYGLQDELTPEVEDKDVTVRKADLQRDIKSLISYAVGCMFGRYSIYQDGLMYAGGIWDYSKYKDAAWRAEGRPDVSDFYTKNHYMPDFDNIIPITDEEYFTDDIVGLFEDFIKTVYGKGALEKNLDFMAKALGNKGNTSREVIRNYFLNDFFKDHCNTYSVTGSGKRPIYWLFDSGKQNGFKALIYMHRYDADTVGKVRTEYLHKAQKYVETAMQSAQYTIDNATSSSEKTKATKAVTKYTKQLAEMKIYDEAIAHVANQRIEIDLDDGVKANYAKFQGVEVSQEGKKALKVDLLAKI